MVMTEADREPTALPAPSWARPILGLCAVAALSSLAGAPLRLLPKHAALEGLPLGELGAALSAARAGEIAAIPLAAALNRRAPGAALGWGALLLGAAIAVLALPGLGLPGLAAALAATQMAGMLVFASSFTLVAEATPAERRTQGLALYWAVLQIARNLVGPALAEGGLSAIGFRPTAALLAAAALAGLLVCRARGEGSARAAAEPDATGEGGGRRDLAAAAQLSAAFFLLGAAFCALDGFASSYAVERGFGAVSPFFACYGAVMLAARLFGGHLPDRYGRGPVLHASLAAFLASFVALLAARSAPVFWAAGALAGLGNCLLWPALYAASYERVRPGAYATALTSLLLAGSGALGSAAFGALAERRGHAAVHAAAVGLCLLAWPLLFVPRRTAPATAPSRPGDAP